MKIYNALKQPIRYKGQICKGDKVRVSLEGGMHPVIELKGNEGRIKYTYGIMPIVFTEERGWLLT